MVLLCVIFVGSAGAGRGRERGKGLRRVFFPMKKKIRFDTVTEHN